RGLTEYVKGDVGKGPSRMGDGDRIIIRWLVPSPIGSDGLIALGTSHSRSESRFVLCQRGQQTDFTVLTDRSRTIQGVVFRPRTRRRVTCSAGVGCEAKDHLNNTP